MLKAGKNFFFKDLRKGKKVVFKRSHVKGKLTKLSEFALVELLKYIYILQKSISAIIRAVSNFFLGIAKLPGLNGGQK